MQVPLRPGGRPGARNLLHSRGRSQRRRGSRPDPAIPGINAGDARRSSRCGSTGTTLWVRCNVDTPDDSVNFLANGWLLYQTLACRSVGRSGFYQSGGAFGFRDQLQDVMALVLHAEPRLRESICCAAPPTSSARATCSTGGTRPAGRGVRTHFSDDYLWLPLADLPLCHGHRRYRGAR